MVLHVLGETYWFNSSPVTWNLFSFCLFCQVSALRTMASQGGPRYTLSQQPWAQPGTRSHCTVWGVLVSDMGWFAWTPSWALTLGAAVGLPAVAGLTPTQGADGSQLARPALSQQAFQGRKSGKHRLAQPAEKRGFGGSAVGLPAPVRPLFIALTASMKILCSVVRN